jgi:hypothetical protein
MSINSLRLRFLDYNYWLEEGPGEEEAFLRLKIALVGRRS